MSETSNKIADEIYEEMVKISGPHANLNIITKQNVGFDIYGSYHFPTFTKLNAQRNVLTRYEEFCVSKSLEGKTVLDFGSNLGSLSFEAARRGAKSVIGFEFCDRRVKVCNKLSNYLGLNNAAKFIETNIDDESQNINNFINKYGCADITICCALDAYVNKDRLYELVSKTTKDICYFETNSGISQNIFINLMKNYGFKLIIPIGTSKSDIGYGRVSYILVKNPKMLDSEPTNRDNFLINDHVFSFYSDKKIFDNIKTHYSKMKDIKYVSSMKFVEPYIVVPFYKNRLDKFKASQTDLTSIKNQLIDFIVQLNRKNLVHCDLHIKNCYFDDGKLKICDWEYVQPDNVPIEKCYDLIAGPNNVIVPESVGKMCIFSSNPYSFMNYLKNNLKLQDFIDASLIYN
ncbi:hypothetical protein CE11_00050 [Megavirus courdo11]|uniref:Methyltransferase domain-containing protein n=1 Tax=Megavirus courdo11 TaxID=1128140 RepID=K7YUZ4_9VIRU|nr:hypothetical protein CE11_00050 [Megavirus courdo11]